MSNLFLTLVIAFVLIVIAIACLAIGWLIKGKTKLEAKTMTGSDIPIELDKEISNQSPHLSRDSSKDEKKKESSKIS